MELIGKAYGEMEGKNEMLNKVPQITVFFWIIKVLCTTVGETAADFLNVNLHLGLSGTSIVMAILLSIILYFQFRANKYVPAIYWLAVVFLSVVGTLITDNLTDNFGVSLVVTSIAFSICLTVTFILWYKFEHTLSIHNIDTRSREAFYWLAILFTFALGTAAGDLIAEQLQVGYAYSGLLFAGVIALTFMAYKFLNLNSVAAFWMAYIITRPLGASIGDLLSQVPKDGGLGISLLVINGSFLITIIGVVVYLSVSKIDTNPKLT